MSGRFFVFIHENQSTKTLSANLYKELELGCYSTSGVHSSPASVLAAGKLYLALGLGRNAVANDGTISPGTHGLQDVSVASQSSTLENQRAVDPPIGADDKAYLDPLAGSRRSQNRIGSR